MIQLDKKCSTLDLICLPLHGIDVIIGMDWLSLNHALFDCTNKIIPLPTCCSNSISSFKNFGLNPTRTVGHLKNEHEGFLVFFSLQVEVENNIEEILIVREYLDVFPKDFSGLPLE